MKQLKEKIQRHIFLAITLCLLLTATAVGSTVYALILNNAYGAGQEKTLDIEIFPRDVKICFGKTKLFEVMIYNGTPPYTVKWYENGTYFDSGISVEYGFKKPCNYVILSVFVKDSKDNIGMDSIFAYNSLGFTTAVEEGSLVTEASYVVFKDGSTYYSRNGVTGEIQFSSTNFALVMENSINQLSSGGVIYIKKGRYTISNPISIRSGTKSLTIKGENGLGKTYLESGTEIISTITNDAIIKISAVDDLRSTYALKITDIKFIAPSDPAYITSVALQLTNLDTGEITACTFGGFGASIILDYQGSNYTTAEQPGKVLIHDNEFTAGQVEYIYTDKITQLYIHDNIFESYGPFKRVLRFRDSNRILVQGNEFDPSVPDTSMEEVIKIEGIAGGVWNPHLILITDNWSHRSNKNYPFLNLNAAPGTEILDIVSRDNMIRCDFMPLDVNDTVGCYVISDTKLVGGFSASDYVAPLSRSTQGWHKFTTNTIYRNLFSPMTIYFHYSIANENDYVKIYIGYDTGAHFYGVIYDRFWSNSTANSRTISFKVPSLFYWKIEVSAGVTLNEVFAMYD